MPNRPPPNLPPNSYRIDGAVAVFYRRVGPAETASIKSLGRLSPPPGGVSDGKYLTTTAELARTWGKSMVKCGWEVDEGSIMEVRVSAETALEVHYVGHIDGIGACYFATFEELDGATISEVKQ